MAGREHKTEARGDPAGQRVVRADFDRRSIVVYQAYNDAIADAALAAGRFVSPFSFQRMTWIKPSFLWLMARSRWGEKAGQTRVLAVRINRDRWEGALSRAVLTDPDPSLYPDAAAWRRQFDRAEVHVQWDPERSLRGAKLGYRSIQVGLARPLVRDFAERWIVDIRDLSALTRKIRERLKAGRADEARRLLPPERPYPLPELIARRLGATLRAGRGSRR